jgi:hypothetical protein
MKSYDLYCELFDTISFLNKGWFWNSKKSITQLSYIIRAIEVVPNDLNYNTETSYFSDDSHEFELCIRKTYPPQNTCDYQK